MSGYDGDQEDMEEEDTECEYSVSRQWLQKELCQIIKDVRRGESERFYRLCNTLPLIRVADCLAESIEEWPVASQITPGSATRACDALNELVWAAALGGDIPMTEELCRGDIEAAVHGRGRSRGKPFSILSPAIAMGHLDFIMWYTSKRDGSHLWNQEYHVPNLWSMEAQERGEGPIRVAMRTITNVPMLKERVYRCLEWLVFNTSLTTLDLLYLQDNGEVLDAHVLERVTTLLTLPSKMREEQHMKRHFPLLHAVLFHTPESHEKVRQLLDIGFSPNYIYGDGDSSETPLIIAAIERCDWQTADALAQHPDFDVNLSKYEYSWHGAYSRATPVGVLLRPSEHAANPWDDQCTARLRLLCCLLRQPSFDWTAVSFRLGEGTRESSLPAYFDSAAPDKDERITLIGLVTMLELVKRGVIHSFKGASLIEHPLFMFLYEFIVIARGNVTPTDALTAYFEVPLKDEKFTIEDLHAVADQVSQVYESNDPFGYLRHKQEHVIDDAYIQKAIEWDQKNHHGTSSDSEMREAEEAAAAAAADDDDDDDDDDTPLVERVPSQARVKQAEKLASQVEFLYMSQEMGFDWSEYRDHVENGVANVLMGEDPELRNSACAGIGGSTWNMYMSDLIRYLTYVRDGWTPQTHKFFPPAFRRAAEEFARVQTHLAILPVDIVLYILSFLDWADFYHLDNQPHCIIQGGRFGTRMTKEELFRNRTHTDHYITLRDEREMSTLDRPPGPRHKVVWAFQERVGPYHGGDPKYSLQEAWKTHLRSLALPKRGDKGE